MAFWIALTHSSRLCGVSAWNEYFLCSDTSRNVRSSLGCGSHEMADARSTLPCGKYGSCEESQKVEHLVRKRCRTDEPSQSGRTALEMYHARTPFFSTNQNLLPRRWRFDFLVSGPFLRTLFCVAEPEKESASCAEVCSGCEAVKTNLAFVGHVGVEENVAVRHVHVPLQHCASQRKVRYPVSVDRSGFWGAGRTETTDGRI